MIRTAFLLPLIFVSFAHAQSSFRGAVSSALGGTGVAGMPAAEGALLNPALVAIFPGASIDANYRDGALNEGGHRRAMALGAIDDGSEKLFSGAVHYVRTRDAGITPRTIPGELWHAAVGTRVNERVAVGASGYRLVHKDDGRALTQWNFGLGALVMISRSFGLAYVIRNPAFAGDRVPTELREELYQALGSYVGLGEMIRLRVDLGRRERRNPDRQLAYMLGLETRTSDLFLLRLGFRHDEAGDGRIWSAGLSFDGPRLKIDYAFQKGIDAGPRSGRDALHSVDLRVPF